MRIRWYGYQTLLADAAALGLMATVATGAPGALTFAALGLGGALLAPPIIHFAHDNAWGYASLALRVLSGALLLRGVTNAFASEDDYDARCTDTCTDLGLAAYGGAVLLDATVFSLRVRRPVASSRRALLTPMLAPGVLGAVARVAF